MKYTSKYTPETSPSFNLEWRFLEWLDHYTMSLFLCASSEVNAADRDDAMLKALGARALFTKLMGIFNSSNKD